MPIPHHRWSALALAFVQAREAQLAHAERYISWIELRATVRISGVQGSAAVASRELLKGLTGVAHPGALLALMGPSGSGKTTLLNRLAGNKGPRSVQQLGEVFYAGQRMRPDIKSHLSYMHQDEIIWAEVRSQNARACATACFHPPLSNLASCLCVTCVTFTCLHSSNL